IFLFVLTHRIFVEDMYAAAVLTRVNARFFRSSINIFYIIIIMRSPRDRAHANLLNELEFDTSNSIAITKRALIYCLAVVVVVRELRAGKGGWVAVLDKHA
ncbi:hypothetical protein ACJX0J_034323, partial [Zea mays]